MVRVGAFRCAWQGSEPAQNLSGTSDSQYVIPEVSIQEVNGMPEFKCADIGMQCGFKAQSPNREELLLKIGVHAAKDHNMTEISEDVLKSIENAIKY